MRIKSIKHLRTDRKKIRDCYPFGRTCKYILPHLGQLQVEVPCVEKQEECRGKGHESQELTQPEICENYSPFITVKLDHMMNILCCLLNQLEKN